jgi:hypothetical protein
MARPLVLALTYLTHHEKEKLCTAAEFGELLEQLVYWPLDNKAVMFGTPTRLKEAAGNQVWHEPVGRLAAVVSQASQWNGIPVRGHFFRR